MNTCRTLLSVLVLVICAAVFAARTTSAGDGFQPVSPEELKLTMEPNAPGATAVVLYRQVDRVDDLHTPHEYNYFRVKILKEEGRSHADVEIPFLKESETVVNIHARTIRPDGSIANFDGKIYEKPLVKARGVKYLAKTFTLPDVQPGSIIEYYYTRDFVEYGITDSHWILSDELYTRRASFTLKPLKTDILDVRVRWSWQRLPQGSEQPKEGPDGIVRMTTSNIPAFETEDYMPPENELKSRVDFVYSIDVPTDNEARFWKSIGKKRNDELESFVGKRKAMEQAVSQIVSPSDSPEVKAQKIYARVQQIRNTSFEVEKTEQEKKRNKEKDINNVEDLWKRGYGNGSQLTWLYLALTRAAGIESYGVWVSSRSDYFFSPVTMDDSKLNTNVVLLKLNGKDVYCDPGSAFVPFGLLPWQETGVQGLRLDKDGGAWVTSKLPDSSESQIKRKAQLKLSDTGDLEGQVTVTYTGLEAQTRRVDHRHSDETERKKYLEDSLKEYIPVSAEVELKNKPDWAATSPTLVAEFDVKITGWVAGAGKRALMPVGFFSGTEKRLFEHSSRVHPIYFEFPFEKVDDVTIDLPLGWQVGSLPKPISNDGHVIFYALTTEDKKGSLHITRDLNVNFMSLEQKYYSALRNFFQVVRSGDESQIVLQPGAAAASN